MPDTTRQGQAWWRGCCVAALLLMYGCSPASMQNGDLSLVQLHSDRPRAGNVYLLRGFIGIWSTGVDTIGREINEAGVRANVYRCEQWRELTDTILTTYKNQKDFEPLVIIGHSWGADHALEMAQELADAKIPIDLLITLDPVTPPPTVSKNIKLCYNIYQPNGAWDTIPFFRGVPLKTQEGSNNLQNVNIRGERTDLLEDNTDHYNIEKNKKIHQEILKQVLAACPPRAQWVASRPALRSTQTAVPAARSFTTAPATPARSSSLSNVGKDNPKGGP